MRPPYRSQVATIVDSVNPRSRQYVVTTALVLIVALVVIGALVGMK
jgi:hypothetical protein